MLILETMVEPVSAIPDKTIDIPATMEATYIQRALIHVHTPSCYKNNKKKSRCGFPQGPMEVASVNSPDSIIPMKDGKDTEPAKKSSTKNQCLKKRAYQTPWADSSEDESVVEARRKRHRLTKASKMYRTSSDSDDPDSPEDESRYLIDNASNSF